jgi:hypothetical protein
VGAKLTSALVAVAGASALLTFASPAGGAVTVGSNLAATPVAGAPSCGFPTCTYTQRTAVSGPLSSPVNGTVQAWRIKGVSGPLQARLRVLRPLAGGAFSFAGSSQVVTVPSATFDVLTFPASVPISIGDRIGLDWIMGGGGNPVFASHATAEIDYWGPAPNDGDELAPPFATSPYELLLNADVEPSNAVVAGKLTPRKRGTALLELTIPNSGRLVLDGSSKQKSKPPPPALVQRQVLRVAAGQMTLLLRATKAAKRTLKRTGRVRGQADLTFTPDQGAPATQRIAFRFKGKRKKRR